MEHLDDETREWMLANTKPCPSCGERFEKNAGCNVMRCPCGIEWDWVSGKVSKPYQPPTASSSSSSSLELVEMEEEKEDDKEERIRAAARERARRYRERKRAEAGLPPPEDKRVNNPSTIYEQLTEEERESYDFPCVESINDLTEAQKEGYKKAYQMIKGREKRKREEGDEEVRKRKRLYQKNYMKKYRDDGRGVEATAEAVEARRVYHKNYMRERRARERKEEGRPDPSPVVYTVAYTWDALTEDERLIYPFPPEKEPKDMTGKEHQLYLNARSMLWKRDKRTEQREKGNGDRTPKMVWNSLSEKQREEFPFPPVDRVKQFTGEERRNWEKFRAWEKNQKRLQASREKQLERIAFFYNLKTNEEHVKYVFPKDKTLAEMNEDERVAYERFRNKTQKQSSDLNKKRKPGEVSKEDFQSSGEEAEDDESRKRKRERQKKRKQRLGVKSNVEKYNKFIKKQKEERRQKEERKSEAEKEKERKRRRELYAAKEPVYATCKTCGLNYSGKNDECYSCRTRQARIQRQEVETLEYLKGQGLFPSLCDDVGPCPSDQRRRADIVYDSPDINYIVIIEVDEDYHRNYQAECEVVRMQQLKDQYPHKPVYFLRYHPERRKIRRGEVTTGGKILDKSKKSLLIALRHIFSLPVPGENDLPLGYAISYLGYPQDRIDELTTVSQSLHQQAFIDAVTKIGEEDKRQKDREKRARYEEKRGINK